MINTIPTPVIPHEILLESNPHGKSIEKIRENYSNSYTLSRALSILGTVVALFGTVIPILLFLTGVSLGVEPEQFLGKEYWAYRNFVPLPMNPLMAGVVICVVCLFWAIIFKGFSAIIRAVTDTAVNTALVAQR